MNTRTRTVMTTLLLSTLFLFGAISYASGEEYSAMKGVKSVKAVYDIRIGNPKSAALHLKLIRQTLKDKAITAASNKPAFVVVYSGPAVKLISKNREGFAPEDQKILDEIATTVSEMSKDGIRQEMCLTAAKIFGVDPASALPEMKQVGNGWISLIGYQEHGYALIPAY